jgi:hypothetical protein
LREKYDWHGSGILRFKIEPGEGLWRRHRKKRRDRLLRRVQDGRPFNTHIWS